MSTQILILMIAAVAGATAIVGYALGRFFETRKARDVEASRSRLGATHATVPGGFVTWLDGGDVVVSDGLTAMLDDGICGFEAFMAKFGEPDHPQITRLIEGMQTRGEGFSLSSKVVEDIVEFCVADTGVGIHADERERMLGKFERGNRPLGRQSGVGVGAGLGLSLVKSFVKLHGGDVETESELDEGTAIVCRLPRHPAVFEPADEPV